MRYLSPYRIAAVILILFCAAHTAGGMLAQKSLGPEADAVFASMKAVHFNFKGGACTWYGFWMGFGLTTSAFLLLSAVIAWQLDDVGANSWPAVSVIAWALVASHVFNAVMSWTYFFAGPGVLSTAVALLLAIGAMRKARLVAVGVRAPAKPGDSS